MIKRELQHKHIEIFRAVIRSGSVTGASRLLGITQPGVSKLLNQTEVLCGFSLFERLHGRLVPTQRALNLFEETERLFVGMEEITRLLDRLRAEEPRRAVVATVPVLAQELLPQVALNWLKEEGRSRLAVTTREAGGVLAMVTSRHAEIGLTCSPPRVPGIRSFLIARCRAMCAIPAGHSLLERDTVRPADLHGQAFVALSRHEGQQTMIDHVLESEGTRPREVVECPLIIGAAAMAHAGVGLTFADAFSARPFLDRGLALRNFEPAIVFEYRAIWAEGLRSPFDRTAFLNLLRDSAQEVVTHFQKSTATKGP